jgi:hypothetical protein
VADDCALLHPEWALDPGRGHIARRHGTGAKGHADRERHSIERKRAPRRDRKSRIVGRQVKRDECKAERRDSVLAADETRHHRNAPGCTAEISNCLSAESCAINRRSTQRRWFAMLVRSNRAVIRAAYGVRQVRDNRARCPAELAKPAGAGKPDGAQWRT